MLRRIMTVALYVNIGLFVVNLATDAGGVDLLLNAASAVVCYLYVKYV